MATWMRFELTTSAVTGRHSNQLNYQAINIFLFLVLLNHSDKHFVGLMMLRLFLSSTSRTGFCTSCNHSMEGPPLAGQACFIGGSNRARTCDPLLVRQMLSQLSYTSRMFVWIFLIIHTVSAC